MTPPGKTYEMIDCHGGQKHEKLPCVVCGRHAGGCLQPLMPTSTCSGCAEPVCMDCERNGRDESVTCAWCRMRFIARVARERHLERTVWFFVDFSAGTAACIAWMIGWATA